jgi:hypothetical protein
LAAGAAPESLSEQVVFSGKTGKAEVFPGKARHEGSDEDPP